MSLIKITVTRKSDGKEVYGNSGNKVKFESIFESEISKYQNSEYTTTREDITEAETPSGVRRARRISAKGLKSKLNAGTASMREVQRVLNYLLGE